MAGLSTACWEEKHRDCLVGETFGEGACSCACHKKTVSPAPRARAARRPPRKPGETRGRPAKRAEEKVERVTFSFPPGTRAWLEEQREGAETLSETARRLMGGPR